MTQNGMLFKNKFASCEWKVTASEANKWTVITQIHWTPIVIARETFMATFNERVVRCSEMDFETTKNLFAKIEVKVWTRHIL